MLRHLYYTSKLSLDFYTGSYVKLDSKWKTSPRRFGNTRLYYVYKGEGVIYHNGNTIPMKAGNLYLIPANLEVGYQCPEYMEKLFFHVAVTSMESFDILSNIPKVCQLPCSEELLTQLKKLHLSDNYYDLFQFKTLVAQTIADCLANENLTPLPPKFYSKEILQAIGYMQNNISIQLTAEQIAQELFISRHRLQKHFKAETGMTIGEYLDQLLVYRASQLMTDTQLSLREISEQLGFCDQFYFSRRFKKLTGQTPSEFRKSL